MAFIVFVFGKKCHWISPESRAIPKTPGCFLKNFNLTTLWIKLFQISKADEKFSEHAWFTLGRTVNSEMVHWDNTLVLPSPMWHYSIGSPRTSLMQGIHPWGFVLGNKYLYHKGEPNPFPHIYSWVSAKTFPHSFYRSAGTWLSSFFLKKLFIFPLKGQNRQSFPFLAFTTADFLSGEYYLC